ncbi:MAG: hypothetical protein KAU95_00145, partial [Candidatus Aenigmarchaeota archaeon]|nr:hypothetical protein [Candidatus Aenigmarchaeota archaeon]
MVDINGMEDTDDPVEEENEKNPFDEMKDEEKNPFFQEPEKADVDFDEITRKRRNADYNYDNFTRSHRNKDFKKSSQYLWSAVKDLTYCIGLFRGKKLVDYAKIIEFLNELSTEGEILKEQVTAVQGIYTNALRNVLDEPMFEIFAERTEKTIRK